MSEREEVVVDVSGAECLAVVHMCSRGVEAVRRGERAGTWKGSITQSR